MAVRTGDVLGERYRLTERIGHGGHGTVWLAHDELLSRQVAVKVLRSDLSEIDEYRTRFAKEGRALATLKSAHVVAIHDSCAEVTADGGYLLYLVMEYITGSSLARRLRDGSIAGHDAVAVIDQIAMALAAVHRAGLVHRDVKPDNIIMSADGQVVLVDFGVAYSTDQQRLTTGRTVFGSHHYTAPEYARGAEPSSASDMYSLAAVVAACLTGTAEPTDLPSGRLPPELEELLRRCLSDDPDRRPTAEQVATACRAADAVPPVRPGGSRAARATARFGHRPGAVLATSTVLALLMIATTSMAIGVSRSAETGAVDRRSGPVPVTGESTDAAPESTPPTPVTDDPVADQVEADIPEADPGTSNEPEVDYVKPPQLIGTTLAMIGATVCHTSHSRCVCTADGPDPSAD